MKPVYLTITLTILTFIATAQDNQVGFGFFTESNLRMNKLELMENTFMDIDAVNNVGYSLGSNFYYLVNDKISFRLTVAVDFGEETLKYYSSSSTVKKVSQVTFITSGFHSIIRTNKKIPLKLVIGVTPFYGIKEHKNNKGDMDFKKFDLTGDLGLSYVISLPEFKIMPEIRYSNSFIDASIDNSIYGKPIESYYRNRVNFGIYLFAF